MIRSSREFIVSLTGTSKLGRGQKAEGPAEGPCPSHGPSPPHQKKVPKNQYSCNFLSPLSQKSALKFLIFHRPCLSAKAMVENHYPKNGCSQPTKINTGPTFKNQSRRCKLIIPILWTKHKNKLLICETWYCLASMWVQKTENAPISSGLTLPLLMHPDAANALHSQWFLTY